MNSIYKIILKIIPAVYFMYLLSMCISMAGMETFAWIGILLAILAGLYEHFVNKQNIFVKHPLNRWFLILACALAVTVITAPYTEESGASKIYYLGRIRNLILFSYHLIIFERFFSYQKALKTLLYFMFPIALYAILHKFTGFDPIKGIWAMHWNPTVNISSAREVFNIYLTYVNVFQFHFFIILSFALMGKIRAKLRTFLILLAAMFMLSFLISNSRAIIIAVFVALLVQVLIARRWIYLIVVGLMIIAPIITYNISPNFKSKADTTFSSINKYGDQNRYGTFNLHLRMFKDQPIKGVGYEMNEPLTPIYNKRLQTSAFVGHSHNILIQMLAGTGLLGTIPFIILWGMLFYMMFSAYRTAYKTDDWYNMVLCHGLIGGFVSFWVNGMTQWNFGDFEVTHNMMFFMAVAGYVWLKTSYQQYSRQ